MAKRKKNELHIYSSTRFEDIFGRAFRAAFASPVRFADRMRSSGKKTSSKRDSAKNAASRFVVYRFRGYPTAEQASRMNRTIGCARFIWNRMLADRKAAIETFGKDALRPKPAPYKNEFPWLAEVDSLALCNTQLNLERAFSDWHSGEREQPRFKKKHVCRDSYTTNKIPGGENISLSEDKLTLPKVPGKIRLKCHRAIRENGILKSVTVTREPDGKWMFAIKFEYPKAEEDTAWDAMFRVVNNEGMSPIRHIGLDMSLPNLYIDSNGNTPSYTLSGENGSIVLFSKQYAKYERRIAKEQRKLSRMVKGSHHYEKQLIRIADLHAKAKHARQDFLRQMAVRIARTYDVISIEDLDMRAMKQSLKFGKSVSDNGWGMFTEFLTAACEKTGNVVIRVDKWFPSSKTCHHCGAIKHDLKLGESTYICTKCGHVMDRDKQAAINIDEEGMRILSMLSSDEPVKMRPAC